MFPQDPSPGISSAGEPTRKFCLICAKQLSHSSSSSSLLSPLVPNESSEYELFKNFTTCVNLDIDEVDQIDSLSHTLIGFCLKCRTALDEWKYSRDQEIRWRLKAKELKSNLIADLIASFQHSVNANEEGHDDQSGFDLFYRIRSDVKKQHENEDEGGHNGTRAINGISEEEVVCEQCHQVFRGVTDSEILLGHVCNSAHQEENQDVKVNIRGDEIDYHLRLLRNTLAEYSDDCSTAPSDSVESASDTAVTENLWNVATQDYSTRTVGACIKIEVTNDAYLDTSYDENADGLSAELEDGRMIDQKPLLTNAVEDPLGGIPSNLNNAETGESLAEFTNGNTRERLQPRKSPEPQNKNSDQTAEEESAPAAAAATVNAVTTTPGRNQLSFSQTGRQTYSYAGCGIQLKGGKCVCLTCSKEFGGTSSLHNAKAHIRKLHLGVYIPQRDVDEVEPGLYLYKKRVSFRKNRDGNGLACGLCKFECKLPGGVWESLLAHMKGTHLSHHNTRITERNNNDGGAVPSTSRTVAPDRSNTLAPARKTYGPAASVRDKHPVPPSGATSESAAPATPRDPPPAHRKRTSRTGPLMKPKGQTDYYCAGILVKVSRDKHHCGECKKSFAGIKYATQHIYWAHAGLFRWTERVTSPAANKFLYFDKIPFSLTGGEYACGVCSYGVPTKQKNHKFLLMRHLAYQHTEMLGLDSQTEGSDDEDAEVADDEQDEEEYEEEHEEEESNETNGVTYHFREEAEPFDDEGCNDGNPFDTDMLDVGTELLLGPDHVAGITISEGAMETPAPMLQEPEEVSPETDTSVTATSSVPTRASSVAASTATNPDDIGPPKKVVIVVKRELRKLPEANAESETRSARSSTQSPSPATRSRATSPRPMSSRMSNGDANNGASNSFDGDYVVRQISSSDRAIPNILLRRKRDNKL